MVGIVLAAAPGLLGCGAGGTATARRPRPVARPGALRHQTLRATVSELKQEGAPAAEISCVKHKIERLSETRLAELVLEAITVERIELGTQGEKLGPLGVGCFYADGVMP